MECPVCDHAPLEVFFEATGVPTFCNVLYESPEAARSASRGDIRLGFCPGCGMIYNTAFNPELATYAEGYENSLHFSPRFQEFAEQLARRLVSTHGLHDAEIVEIGSGQGDFLGLLCKEGGNRGIGFDPSAADPPADVSARPFQIRREHFSPESVQGPADLICCRHVLEHIERPRDFMSMLAAAAREAGSPPIYLEVPDGLWTLRDLGIWDIIYEHCSYFVPSSLTELLRRSGLYPVSVESEFGGQFLCADISVDEKPTVARPEDGLATLPSLVESFAGNYRGTVARWKRELGESKERGLKVALWGAGSKGVTFLNIVTGSNVIDFVVDVNPRKTGRHVAGTGHRVVAPAELVGQRVDRILVMNPVYVDEIRSQARSLGLKPQVVAVD